MKLISGISDWVGIFTLNNLFLPLALIFVLFAVAILIIGRKQEKETQQIHLRELSKLWTKEHSGIIHIAQLSTLWRNEQIIAIDDNDLHFDHPRIVAFWEKIEKRAWFEKFPQQRSVCAQLLKLLDQEGLCPSVVKVHSDVEGGWDENTFQLLAKTTLLDHSINVAEQVVQLLAENKAWHVIPDTMVAALAHDLGKIESMRGFLYSLGEHPLASGRPLSGIRGFRELPKKEEILQAVKHHHKRPQSLLGKTLKKADQLARQKELEEAALHNDSKIGGTLPVPDKEKTAAKDTASAAWQAEAEIFGESHLETARSPTIQDGPQLIDITRWFDVDRFLNDLKPYINKMFGRRFLAFSMPDGHVYFQAKVLEEVARKQAERAGCMEIATMGQRDETMRSVLFTIVHHLKTEHDVIARGLIKESFFGGYFTVTRKIGKTIKGYYTPFHAEPFGSIAEMEQAKPEMLRDIVQVSPYLDNEPTDQ